MKLNLSAHTTDSTAAAADRDEEICTNSLRVIGRPKLPSKDMLIFSFESKRLLGGGDILDIIYDADDVNSATILFKDPNGLYQTITHLCFCGVHQVVQMFAK